MLQKQRGTDGLSSFLDRQTRAFWSGAVSAVRSHAFKINKAMTLEQLQDKLQSSLEHFVNLGNVLKSSYPTLYPSEQGMMIYSLLIAGRRLATLMKEAQWWQERFIPDVTGIDLVKTRGDLLNLMEYLSQCDCDMEIGFLPSENAEPIFESDEIVDEENRAQYFPPKEQDSVYTKARRLLIESSTDNYAELEAAIKGANTRIDNLIYDAKKLKRNKESRIDRYKTMRDFYMKRHWEQDKKMLIARAQGELKDEDNKNEPEVVILENLLQDMLSDNTLGNNNRTLGSINLYRDDVDDVTSMMIEGRDTLTVDDMFAHFRFIESEKLLVNHMNTKTLMVNCSDYQGKLFTSKAAYEFAKLIGCAVKNYVGFENKMNAAFLFYAMRDLELVFDEENNATLMTDFIKDVYEEEISSDTITKPLRKTNGQAFCMIDERNLRSFTDKEFQKYKEPYWLCYSIINKVLDKRGVECAGYLDQLHPTIASKDVFENLEEEEKTRLYFLSSVLRGDSLMF